VKAVDTNVLVRVVTGDDEAQAPVAARALARGVFVSHGVLMELEWVLRSTYKWPRERISQAIGDLLIEPAISIDDRASLLWAVDRFAQGADWADMLHIIDAAGSDAFLSFERDLETQAGPAAPVKMERLQ
jgi:predicted nucleic-acid-binding protein